MLFSLHLKATMMKVSDPIIFGHARARVLRRRLRQARRRAGRRGRQPEQRPAAILTAIETLPDDEREAIEAAIADGLRDRPALAMVDSTAASPTCTCRAT